MDPFLIWTVSPGSPMIRLIPRKCWYDAMDEEGDGFKGTLMVNCETPDGYTVDVNGALVE